MNENIILYRPDIEWFAIRARHISRVAEVLSEVCDEVYFPTETVMTPIRGRMVRAVIPHVMFIRTDRDTALRLEAESRRNLDRTMMFWIYRYPTDNTIRPIPPHAISLLRLLTADDTTRCEIFNKKDFRENEHVRITGGIYKGYKGYVQRVRKNRHVIVKIEGVCLVMLPFIHPDFLESID